jgi:anti-sigma factor RsiW
MNCKEAIKYLYIQIEGNSLSSEVIAAKEHAFGCPRCREFFEAEDKIKNLLFEKAPRRETPPDLKEKIYRGIEEPSYFKRFKNTFLYSKLRVVSIVVISTVLALIASLSLISYIEKSNKESRLIINEIINQHIKYLHSSNPVDIISSKPEELESWFKGRVDFLVKAPRFQGTNLVGGRLCYLFKKRVAVLVYKKQEQSLSLFIIDQPNLDISSMDMVDIDGKKLYCGFGKGFNLVLWKDRGLIYALVSEVKEMELLRLASISNGG